MFLKVGRYAERGEEGKGGRECVCERERERGGGREMEREREIDQGHSVKTRLEKRAPSSTPAFIRILHNVKLLWFVIT